MSRVMFRNLALLAALTGSTMLIAGCSNAGGEIAAKAVAALKRNEEKYAVLKPVNQTCPIHANRGIDLHVKPDRYKGRLVGFCSSACANKWEHLAVVRRDTFINRQLQLARARGESLKDNHVKDSSSVQLSAVPD